MDETVLLQNPWLGVLVVVVLGGMLIWVDKVQQRIAGTSAPSGGAVVTDESPYRQLRRRRLRKLYLDLCFDPLLLGLVAYLDAMGATELCGLPRGTLFEFYLGVAASRRVVMLLTTLKWVRLAQPAMQLGWPVGDVIRPWLVLKAWTLEMAAAAVLLVLPSLFPFRPFLIGGVVVCALVSVEFWRKATRLQRSRAAVPTPPPPA